MVSRPGAEALARAAGGGDPRSAARVRDRWGQGAGVSARQLREGFPNIDEFVIVIAFDRRAFLSTDQGVGSSKLRAYCWRRDAERHSPLAIGVGCGQLPAPVAELVDALDSGSSGRKPVEVRVLSGALAATPYDAPCTAQVLKLVDRPD